MLKHRNKISGIIAVAAVALPMTVMAASTNIGATAEFLNAITFTNQTDMDFGVIEFTGVMAGADATIGTNGNIAYNIFAGSPTGTPGSVEILTGTAAELVDVYCSDSVTLEEAGGETIDLINIDVTLSTATAGPGAGNDCDDNTTAAIAGHSLTVGDVFVFGGQLDGDTASGSFTAGVYDTLTSADPIQVDVFYQ